MSRVRPIPTAKRAENYLRQTGRIEDVTIVLVEDDVRGVTHEIPSSALSTRIESEPILTPRQRRRAQHKAGRLKARWSGRSRR